MPEEVQQLAPKSQGTYTPKPYNWKKVILTIVFIVGVVAVVSGVYWFMVVNRSAGDSDLTGPVPNVNTKTSTESAEETPPLTEKDKTANWKTYTNQECNFKIKYPEKLELMLDNNKIDEMVRGSTALVLRSKEIDDGQPNPSGYYYTFECDPNRENVTAELWVEKKAIALGVADSVITENVELNGIRWVKVKGLYTPPKSLQRSYVTTKDGKIHLIKYQALEENIKLKNKEDFSKILDQILSTFKFFD